MAVESHDKKLDDLLKMVEELKKVRLNYPTFNVVGFGMTRRYVN